MLGWIPARNNSSFEKEEENSHVERLRFEVDFGFSSKRAGSVRNGRLASGMHTIHYRKREWELCVRRQKDDSLVFLIAFFLKKGPAYIGVLAAHDKQIAADGIFLSMLCGTNTKQYRLGLSFVNYALCSSQQY
ncbi:hypothetical protein HPP92_023214 [Vanilla planifolia]|uniref:Uncharacterized protein n=1 Tax=Vanilla planifolia TaxID=51239 RepID=A0A835PV18_VANPL|nr:hypothetical protein HPP92_023214 [Vanilla planifolia]